jgi:hypothetical protein
MQLVFVAATHSAALLTKRLSESVDGVKEKGCGGVPIAKEMPLERTVPSAETELLAQGKSNGVEPFAQAIVTTDILQECKVWCCVFVTASASHRLSWGQP